jgi:hypothetical protein
MSAIAAHKLENRRFERFVTPNAVQFYVTVALNSQKWVCKCLDYNAFGVGLITLEALDASTFQMGQKYILNFDFFGSKFWLETELSNAFPELIDGNSYVRLGFKLLPTTTQMAVVDQRRVADRVVLDTNYAPVVRVYEEFWYGDPIFGKVVDVSLFGIKVAFDKNSLPFLEKQRLWITLTLPGFGQARLYTKIAYIRHEMDTAYFLVGLNLIKSQEDSIDCLEDWLFYSDPRVSTALLKNAKFPCSHFSPNDETCRFMVLSDFFSGIMAQEQFVSGTLLEDSKQNFVSISLVGNSENVCSLEAELDNTERILTIKKFYASPYIQDHPKETYCALFKTILVFCLWNKAKTILFSSNLVEHTNQHLNQFLVLMGIHHLTFDVESFKTSGKTKSSCLNSIKSELSHKPGLQVFYPPPFGKSLVSRVLKWL